MCLSGLKKFDTSAVVDYYHIWRKHGIENDVIFTIVDIIGKLGSFSSAKF